MRRIAILVFFLFAPYIFQSQTTCTNVNLWSNGDFESTVMSCYLFNAVNDYIPPRGGQTNRAFRWKANEEWMPNLGFLEIPPVDQLPGTPQGHFLYVDPAEATGWSTVVSQSIPVQQGTTYTFSAWFYNMLYYSPTPATVRLRVHNTGGVISTVNQSTPTWKKRQMTWTAGFTGFATFRIECRNPMINGHDFGVDNIQVNAPFTVNAGADKAVCVGDTFSLQGTMAPRVCDANITYSWEPPTGLTGSLNSSLVQGVAGTPGDYFYSYTVTQAGSPSCSDIVKVTVFDDCCNLEIDTVLVGCNRYLLTANSLSRYTIKHLVWTVNGQVWTPGELVLSGPTIVCVHGLLANPNNLNDVCCVEKCITLQAPVAVEQAVELSTCPLSNNGTILLDPAQYCAGSNYILSGATASGAVIYHSSVASGSIIHSLQPGSYQLDCFNSNGCLIKRVSIGVSTGVLVENACYLLVTDSCSAATNPNLVVPECNDCVLTNPSALQVLYSSSNVTRYQRTYTDASTCRRCIFTFDIQQINCSIEALFTSVQTANPSTYTFTNSSITNGVQCLPTITWQVFHLSANDTLVYNQAVTGNSFTYTFGATGTYRVRMNHCVCLCNGECCDNYEMQITINGISPMIEDGGGTPSESRLQMMGENDSRLQVSPNPAVGSCKVQLVGSEVPEEARLILYNSEGRVAATAWIINRLHELDLSKLPAGNYFISVESGGKRITEKLVHLP